MSGPIQPELIWAHNIDEVKIGPIHLAFDIEIERNLQGDERLTFSMFTDDPKLVWMGPDQLVTYDGEGWRIDKRNDGRTNNERVVTFTAFPRWYDLADDVRYGYFLVSVQTLTTGLAQILAGSGWSVGAFSDDGTTYSFDGTNLTTLELLRKFASITHTEIMFDTEDQVVYLMPNVGTDRNIGFRYGRNLDEVQREYTAPKATVLYPQGANDLNIVNVNAGLPYVENFDWYTAQGMTLADARAKYTKAAVWVDTDFIVGLQLMDAAVAKLVDLSQPTISYALKVLDLSGLTGMDEYSFQIGDVVSVDDSVLELSIKIRIVRYIKRPYEPWNNEIELSYLKPGLSLGMLGGTNNIAGNNQRDWNLIVDESESLTVATSFVYVCVLDVTTTANSNGILGGLVVGTGVGNGTLLVSCYVDGVQLGTNILKPFTNGQQIEVGIPSWMSGLEEGTHEISLRVRVSSGTGTFSIEEKACRLYVMMTGALGGGVGGGNPLVRVGDALSYQPINPSDLLDTVTTLVQADIEEFPYELLPYVDITPADFTENVQVTLNP